MNEWSFVSVDLELTNQCSNGCLICPRKSIYRPIGFMEQETFDVICDRLIEENSYITFSGMGDPLLHPKVFQFIKAIRKKGGNVGIVINPKSLNSNVIDNIIKAGPNIIKVSFPSLQKDVFERLFPELTFKQGLDLTNELIKNANGSVGIQITGIITGMNLNETELFTQSWKSKGVSAEMRLCHSRGGNFINPAIHTINDIGLKKTTCGMFTFHSFITWQADLLSCCHDLSGKTKFGNLITEDIETISKKKQEIVNRNNYFEICLLCDEPLRHLPAPKGVPPKDKNSRKRFFRSLKKGSTF